VSTGDARGRIGGDSSGTVGLGHSCCSVHYSANVTLPKVPQSDNKLSLCPAKVHCMFKTKSLSLLLILSLILCISAKGQEPMTQKQLGQVNKVRKNLAHYDKGTKLDVRLSDGSHHIGTLSQTGSTSFVIVDPVSSKSESVDYLDVKRVQPTRKEYVSKQLGKTVNGIPKSAEIALIAVGVGLLLAVLAGGIHD